MWRSIFVFLALAAVGLVLGRWEAVHAARSLDVPGAAFNGPERLVADVRQGTSADDPDWQDLEGYCEESQDSSAAFALGALGLSERRPPHLVTQQGSRSSLTGRRSQRTFSARAPPRV